MKLTLNGHEQDIAGDRDTLSVAELLAALKLAGQPVAVEVNKQLVPKRRHDRHALQPGDRVEIVTLVGGG